MSFSVTATQLTLTGAEPSIDSLEIEGQLIDFTAYVNSLNDITQGTTYTATLNGFTNEADAFIVGGAQQTNSDIAFQVIAPLFSVDIASTSPVNTADIDLSIGTPVFGIVADSIAPTNNAQIDLSVSGPIFQVIAGGAELIYYYAKGTQIQILEPSTHIELVELSTHVKATYH